MIEINKALPRGLKCRFSPTHYMIAKITFREDKKMLTLAKKDLQKKSKHSRKKLGHQNRKLSIICKM
jgi:hypothetical protein